MRVAASARVAVQRMLEEIIGDSARAHAVEGAAHHAAAGEGQAYATITERIVHATQTRPQTALDLAPAALACASSDALARGTEAEEVRRRRRLERDAVLNLIEAHVEEMRTEVSAGSSIVVCGKCKSDNVQWEQKQTRGADEPMTLFCKCMACGKQWRM